jgi:hypothetical protein
VWVLFRAFFVLFWAFLQPDVIHSKSARKISAETIQNFAPRVPIPAQSEGQWPQFRRNLKKRRHCPVSIGSLNVLSEDLSLRESSNRLSSSSCLLLSSLELSDTKVYAP